MSTYIEFKDGTNVHILDICVCGKLMHKFIETGYTYEREGTAVKRAINLNRKKRHNSIRVHHHRKHIKHCRRTDYMCEIIKPTIVGYYVEGKKRYLVVETGKIFKRENNAILNAMDYVRNHTK